jgi:hypothetical protein
MRAPWNRRDFLRTSSALGVGLTTAPAWATALVQDAALGPDAVQYRPEIEPVVRWIEQTPRDRIVEAAAGHLRDGLSYRDFMAGVFLAAIRNIKPRPVGFKFHAVMALHSAHLLAMAAAPEQRLLPLFWALDNFKGAQQQDVQEGDWTLAKVDEARLPGPTQAHAAFVEAMDAWDSDKADAATAALCRSAGAGEVMEAFWRVGLRDQRNIGHKPIFTMQCWRTLQTIGWQHAEPVLRSLAFGLLDTQGDRNPEPAGPYRANLENARKVREGWTVGRRDPGATQALLQALREASSEAAAGAAVEQLNAGVAPESLWDAVLLAASELLMRAPGIVALHAVTAANSLHYIFGASGDDTTRKLALLQAAGWVPLYRQRAQGGNDVTIDAYEAKAPDSQGAEAVAEVFATANDDRVQAAAKLLGYAERGGALEPFFAEARQLIFLKGRDSHQYKYGGAAWEECLLAADDRWRAPLAAATLFYVPSAGAPDSPVMVRARDALARL